MLIGGAIVKQDGGMQGLAIIIAGLFVLIILYSGVRGLIFGIIGILILITLWFIYDQRNVKNHMNKDNSQNNNIKLRPKIENKLGKQLRKNLQSGLAKKYPKE